MCFASSCDKEKKGLQKVEDGKGTLRRKKKNARDLTLSRMDESEAY